MVARIIGTGSAVPENIVTNDDLSKVVDTTMSGSPHGPVSGREELRKKKIQQFWHAVPQKVLWRMPGWTPRMWS